MTLHQRIRDESLGGVTEEKRKLIESYKVGGKWPSQDGHFHFTRTRAGKSEKKFHMVCRVDLPKGRRMGYESS